MKPSKEQSKLINKYVRNFKREVKKLPKFEVPEKIKQIAEQQYNFKFN